MADPLRRRVRARALRGLARLSDRAPEPLVRGALGAAAGLARFSRFERLALDNLELALGADTSPAERRRIAAGVRRHAARQLYEWARLARGPGADGAGDRWLRGAVRLDASVERLRDAVGRDGGAIVVTAHLGNWELLAAALRRHGLDGAVVGRRRARDPSSSWLVEMRAAWGVESLSQDGPPRRLLEVLARGGVLGLLPDLEVRRLAGEFAPFFGRPALTLTAPAALARASGLPLHPARCVRPRDASPRTPYRLSVDPPLHLDRSLPRREATLALLRALNLHFEGWIRQTPEQWAWHQPRWRTRPGDPVAGAAPTEHAADAPPSPPEVPPPCRSDTPS